MVVMLNIFRTFQKFVKMYAFLPIFFHKTRKMYTSHFLKSSKNVCIFIEFKKEKTEKYMTFYQNFQKYGKNA